MELLFLDASWHNLGATALGWMPFSLTNISAKGSIGNPLALHAGETSTRPESWQHIHVVTLRALADLFTLHGFAVVARFGGAITRSGAAPAGHSLDTSLAIQTSLASQ